MKKIYLLLLLFFISIFGFSQSSYVSEKTKKIVFTRDGGKCQCCGSYSNIEYDHIIPTSCGGGSSVSNIQLLCLRCNRSKSNSCYCKVHNRKVGTNCCQDKATYKPSITTVQCIGTTKKGSRCRKKTTNASGRCHLH